MIWANKAERWNKIFIALGFTTLVLGYVYIWVVGFMTLPEEFNRTIPKSERGKVLFRSDDSTHIDFLINKCKSNEFILAALEEEKLEKGDLLLRIIVGKSSKYWRDTFDNLEKMENTLFWREAGVGDHIDYRILYIGPIKSDETKDDFLNRYGLGDINLKSSFGLVERIGSSTKSDPPNLVMEFVESWPLQNN